MRPPYTTLCFLLCFLPALVGCASRRMCIVTETAFAGEKKEISLAGKGKAMIDWGDGSEPEIVTLRDKPENLREIYETDGWKVPHIYAAPGAKIISVTGRIAGTAAGIRDDATAVERLRYMCAGRAIIDHNLQPVTDMNETLAYNGQSFPVLGYERLESRGLTSVIIQREHTAAFAAWQGGKLEEAIKGKVTINAGKYAGTWNAWFVYTTETLPLDNVNIYIDAPWKE